MYLMGRQIGSFSYWIFHLVIRYPVSILCPLPVHQVQVYRLRVSPLFHIFFTIDCHIHGCISWHVFGVPLKMFCAHFSVHYDCKKLWKNICSTMSYCFVYGDRLSGLMCIVITGACVRKIFNFFYFFFVFFVFFWSSMCALRLILPAEVNVVRRLGRKYRRTKFGLYMW